jgi:hypothetical protein
MELFFILACDGMNLTAFTSDARSNPSVKSTRCYGVAHALSLHSPHAPTFNSEWIQALQYGQRE